MKLSEGLIKHIDVEIFELVKLLEVTNDEAFKASQHPQGSLGLKTMAMKVTLTSNYLKSTDNSIVECDPVGKCLGFSAENHKRFEKFIDALYKVKDVNDYFSRGFLEKISFKWIISTRQAGKADTSFSSFFMTKCEDSIEHLVIYFPMLYFETEVPFVIGKTAFGFYTKEFFDEFIKNSKNKDAVDSYIDMQKEYLGETFVMCEVHAEKERAKEIAFEECSLAVDILKVCSHTLDFPNKTLNFDIDKRIRHTQQSETIVEVVKDVSDLEISLDRGGKLPFQMNQVQFTLFEKRGLMFFHEFYRGLSVQTTELEAIVILGIQRFALALSVTNLTQRVAELFTILESLLLTDEVDGIIDSVSIYTSKLVSKRLDERKQVIGLLKNMYKARSKYVHHAKESEFDMRELRRLQRTVHALLIELIRKTTVHTTKKSVLQEIDDAILGAY